MSKRRMPEPVVTEFICFRGNASEDRWTVCGLVLMHTHRHGAWHWAFGLGRSTRRHVVEFMSACGGWMGAPDIRWVIVFHNEVTG
jgi:hypothetical protein